MEDGETARMRIYGESKTTRIMMAAVPHVTSGSELRKFQAVGFLLDRVYSPFILIRVARDGNQSGHPSVRLEFHVSPSGGSRVVPCLQDG
jgi:hypothetical protein